MKTAAARAVIGTLTALSVAASEPASAALVRVDFAGSVERLSGQIYDYSGEPIPISPEEAEAALGGSIQVGTHFSGYFVYDDSATLTRSTPEGGGGPGSFPSPATAFYSYPDGFAAHGEIGGFARDGDADLGDGLTLDVGDNELNLGGANPSSVFVRVYLGSPPAPEDSLALTVLYLYASGASSGSPLHGTSLQSIPWDLESFPQTSADFFFQNGNLQVQVEGAVTRLVPEPAGTSLVALAGCAILAACRRFFRV